MGVRGLTTFFNQNPEFFKPFKLHNSLVIFDGDNLIHALYFNNRIDSMYGGDYKRYADSVRKYLFAFLKCNIKPLIIFDGGYDISGRKMKTIAERAKKRLAQVKLIANSGSCYERVLPILARTVFMSVLVELDIVFAICDYEADDQITALANYYKCPVISADSDFYIYDVHEGFIRLDSVDTTLVLDIDSDGKEYTYLSCNIYRIDQFVSYFPGIDKSVLPLFGALMGNDYVEAYEFDNFFSNIQLPKYKGKKLILNSKQKKMIGLLCWLKNYTLDDAVNHVMEFLKKDKRVYIRSVLENAVGGYELNSSNLTSIIDKKLHYHEREMNLSSRVTFPCGNPVPLDFILKFHRGQYSSFFINVIVLRKVFLSAQIEDISLESSYACARYIRKIIYGILIRHNVNDNACQNEKCLAPLEENDRHGPKFQKDFVEPLVSIENFGMLPKLNDLSVLTKEESVLILTKVLNIDSNFFSNLIEEWQLLIGCINYWLCNCDPHCTESFLYALILNMIYFGVILNKFSKDQDSCLNKKSADDRCPCSTVQCILSKINQFELENAAARLKKYIHQPSVNHGHPLQMHIIHRYSQLQSCVSSIVLLNKLLGNFLRSPNPHKCFSGTMLYNLTKDISTRSKPKLYVAEILGRETNLYTLFTALLFKMSLDVPYNYILKNESTHQKHKKKSSRPFDSVCKNDSPALKNFKLLNRVEML